MYFIYKISHTLYQQKIPLLPKLLQVFAFFLFNSYLPYKAKIGKGTKFAYKGIAIVIHDRAVIGQNCVIGTCVTIGGKSKVYEVPVIGNNVYIASGAKVLGPITIGDNVVIGANAVVVKDIPSNSIVGGVPAKILKSNININDYI